MIKKSILILIFIIMLFPMYFMIIGSFQNIQGIMKMPPALIPNNPTFDNYLILFKSPVLLWLKNTIFVTALTVILTIILCSSAGYSFAYYDFKHKNILWGILLLGIMIPRISLIIPQFVIIKKLGLSGTLLATVLPIVYYPVGLYLARIYFETIPKSLLESARLDGANEVQILIKIIMPMSKPIITCLALFAAIGVLQDYIWQMLILQKEENQTILIGMMKLALVRQGGTDANINPISKALAVGTILLFPLVIMFLVSNKFFTQSLGGAIKE